MYQGLLRILAWYVANHLITAENEASASLIDGYILTVLIDVCGVLLIANIIRIFFWLGNRFETRKLLLLPSFMILTKSVV